MYYTTTRSNIKSIAITTLTTALIFTTINVNAKDDNIDGAQYITPEVENHAESPWKFELIPYVWVPKLNGQVGVDDTYAPVGVSSTGNDNPFDTELDSFAFFSFDARYKKTGLSFDFMDIRATSTSPSSGVLLGAKEVNYEFMMVDLQGTYRVFENEKGFVDLTGGARYMGVDIDIAVKARAVPGINVSGHKGWIDAVVGVRGSYQLSKKWFVSYGADVGTGASDISWQAFGGIGYHFNDHVFTSLRYRYMDYDYSTKRFDSNVTMKGVGLALGFTW